MDVEQLYEEMEQMENKDKSGFFVELTNLKGKVVYIVFYAGNTKSVHVVPLQQTVVIQKSKNMQKGIRYWKTQGSAALVGKVAAKVRTASTRKSHIRSGSSDIFRDRRNWNVREEKI